MSVINELPQWASAVASVGTFVVAVVAWRLARDTLRQRTGADARGHWWNRTRWAIERAQDHDDPETRRVAVDILRLRATSELAKEEELLIMDAIQEPIVNAYRDRSSRAFEPEAGYVGREEPEEVEGGPGGVH